MITIDQIIQYVLNTTYNTNPNVLITLLNNLSSEDYPDATGELF